MAQFWKKTSTTARRLTRMGLAVGQLEAEAASAEHVGQKKTSTTARRLTRMGLAVGQLEAEAASAEHVGHGYSIIAEVIAEDAWKNLSQGDLEKLVKIKKQRAAASVVAAAGSFIDLYGGLGDPEFGTIADDWNAIGRDFAAVGGDLVAALRADLAKRSEQ